MCPSTATERLRIKDFTSVFPIVFVKYHKRQFDISGGKQVPRQKNNVKSSLRQKLFCRNGIELPLSLRLLGIFSSWRLGKEAAAVGGL
jgi:hypothetical protein